MAGVSRRSHQGVLLLAALLANHSAHALDANALPTGGTVSAGSATIATSGNRMTVTQTSQNVAINWPSYNIGKDASVTYIQPNASAIALNRALGTDGTQILGSLKANGQVWILNPNGVLFGKGAQVDVGGLVASTLNLSDADFLSGKRGFAGTGGNVVNQGEIHAGYVALLGEQVVNEGVIVANLGTAVLAAGNRITLDFNGDRLLNVQVDEGALKALADNRGLVQADGGTILMTARAKDALFDTAVNNSGILQARTVASEGGVIKLLSDMESGTVNVGGTIDATGGFVETSAHKVSLQAGASVKVSAGGHWLIDPTDIIIDGTAAGIIASTLDGGGNVSETTAGAGSDAGNITVASAITWNGSGTLTLTADHDILLQAALSGHNGGLTLNAANAISATAAVDVSRFTLQNGTWSQVAATLPGFSAQDFRLDGGTFVRALNGAGTGSSPYRLTDIYGVQGMGSSGMKGNAYVLANDIDAAGTANWNGGAGFAPIGPNGNDPFTGSLDGLGYTISGLTINRPTTNSVGLFGWTNLATVQNVGVVNASIVGQDNVGALAGVMASSGGDTTISRVYATGSVTGRDSVGGLIGTLSGYNAGSSSPGMTLTDSFAAVSVTGSASHIGGLVGYVYSSSGRAVIANSYASGSVMGAGDQVGGLVGILDGTGDGNSRISNSYAIGSVSGHADVGGLVGFVDASSFGFTYIINTYAAGAVNGVVNYGGLVGNNGGSGNSSDVKWSFWDVQTSGQSAGFGVNGGNWTANTGLNTAQMKTLASFTGGGWSNIDDAGGTSNTWRIYEGMGYPLLRSLMTPLTVTAIGGSKTYDGTSNSGSLYTAAGSYDSTKVQLTGVATAAVNAGTYDFSLYSGQTGYDLIGTHNGTLDITPRPVTVTANAQSKTAGQADPVLTYAVGCGSASSPCGLVTGESLGGSLARAAGEAAGSYTIGQGTVTQGSNPNYALTYVAANLTVAPAAGSFSGTSGGTARTPAEMAASSAPYAGVLAAAQAGQPAATMPASAGAPMLPAAITLSVPGLPGLEIAEDL